MARSQRSDSKCFYQTWTHEHSLGEYKKIWRLARLDPAYVTATTSPEDAFLKDALKRHIEFKEAELKDGGIVTEDPRIDGLYQAHLAEEKFSEMDAFYRHFKRRLDSHMKWHEEKEGYYVPEEREELLLLDLEALRSLKPPPGWEKRHTKIVECFEAGEVTIHNRRKFNEEVTT